jgi:Caspase domain
MRETMAAAKSSRTRRASSDAAAASTVRDRAIVVGISRYPQFGVPPPNNLNGPVRDAEDMAKWLSTSAGAHVTLVTSVLGKPGKVAERDMHPTRSEVDAPFEGFIGESLRLASQNRSSRLSRRLYVYMAGHGFAPEPRALALIMANAIGDQSVPNVEATAWVDWFADQLHFDELVLWMDCCATRAYDFASGKPMVKKAAARQDGRAKVFMAFAAKPSAETYEGPVGPKREVRGIFTAHLLRGLKVAGGNAQGIVTTSSLVSFLTNHQGLTGDAPTQGSTTPTGYSFPATDEMVLGRIPLPKYKIRVPVPNGRNVRLQDGAGALVTTGVVKSGAIRVPLAVGLYKAEGENGFSKVFEIASGTGRHVDLAKA